MPTSSSLRGLKQRAQFLRARTGRTERRRHLVIQAVRRPQPTDTAIGQGFTATKKIGSAVTRNRAKRRLREAARALLPCHGVAGADYVFIARQTTANCAWSHLLDEMKSALISLAPYLTAPDDAGDPPS